MNISSYLALGALALAIPAAGCSKVEDDTAETASAEEVSDGTLADLLADQGNYDIARSALDETGLEGVFDGAASYTLLLPTDAVFEGLGSSAEDLQSEEGRAALVAIMRDHIVPGYLAPEDISAAIDSASGAAVEMSTVGDATLSFAKDGEAIVVTGADGATARFAGTALKASNGVAIPVDGLLKPLGASAEAAATPAD